MWATLNEMFSVNLLLLRWMNYVELGIVQHVGNVYYKP